MVLPLGDSMPLISSFPLIRLAIGSTAQANNKGDSGHPCLTPLMFLNGLDDTLLLVTHHCAYNKAGGTKYVNMMHGVTQGGTSTVIFCGTGVAVGVDLEPT